MLNDDAIRAILGRGPVPPKISMMHPLTLSLPAEQVVRLLELVVSSESLDVGGGKAIVTPAERLRCLDLLEWARGTAGPMSVSIYPTAEDGLDDLEDIEAMFDEDGASGDDAAF